jgi:hypothetical protein
LSPSLFPLKTMHQHKPAHQMIGSLTLQDPRVLNSQVAVASFHRSSTSNNARTDIVTGLKHQQQAISLIKDWLATTVGCHVDIGAVVCILQLAGLEVSSTKEIYLNTIG